MHVNTDGYRPTVNCHVLADYIAPLSLFCFEFYFDNDLIIMLAYVDCTVSLFFIND